MQDGRLVRLRIHLLDKPGALHDLTRLIAENHANIVDTLHNRAYYGVNLGETVIDITMETRGPDQVIELLQALTSAGSVIPACCESGCETARETELRNRSR